MDASRDLIVTCGAEMFRAFVTMNSLGWLRFGRPRRYIAGEKEWLWGGRAGAAADRFGLGGGRRGEPDRPGTLRLCCRLLMPSLGISPSSRAKPFCPIALSRGLRWGSTLESAEIKRERARCIRECGGGFSDSVSRTLIDLAEGLEIEADAIEKGSAADQIATNPLE